MGIGTHFYWTLKRACDISQQESLKCKLFGYSITGQFFSFCLAYYYYNINVCSTNTLG